MPVKRSLLTDTALPGVKASHPCRRWPTSSIWIFPPTPHKASRIQRYLSLLIPKLTATREASWQPDRPTVLERYIAGRLDGTHSGRWIDDVQLDVAIHTAEVFGAMALRGPKASWEGAAPIPRSHRPDQTEAEALAAYRKQTDL